MRTLPVRATALDTGGQRLAWTAGRRWLTLQAAVGAGLAAVFLRYFQNYLLTTPLGRFWGVADDIFISASFARTLAQGGGLVWFPDAPRVEGFSNPLWVLLLAAIHRYPWFRETRLGFYVAIVDTVVLFALGALLVGCVRRVVGEARSPTLGTGAFVTLVCVIASIPLCICASCGFETGAAALFSVAALYAALSSEAKAPWAVAVLTGLAFWTRMDAVITCLPALVTVGLRPEQRQRALGPALLLAFVVAAQFALRRWYYGAWLPNTYYLKASGWSFSARVGQGLIWNTPLIWTTVLVTLPGFFLVRRALGRAAMTAALTLGAFALTVLYSLNNGGDLMYVFGHDRFNAVGAVFLAMTVCIVALQLNLDARRRAAGAVASIVMVLGPFLYPFPREAIAALVKIVDIRSGALPQDTPAAMWAYHGRILRQVTKPGARIAVCAAGATVYFSHRGGVDLLGKVEPLVAHLTVPKEPPPEARCWRGFPGAGHNKEDVPGTFAARVPELSVVYPPAAIAPRYVRIRFRGLEFFALKNSAYVNWDEVENVGDLG